MKKFIIIILFLIITVPISYYYYSLKKANYDHYQKWYSDEYFPDSFVGVVSEIQKFDDFYVVSINVPNENDRVFNVCQNEITFQKGDSILKNKETYNLFIIHHSQKEEIELSFCKK